MALTAIGLCARALIKIGATPISDFTDGTAEAEVAQALYAPTRDSLLGANAWSFATAQATLARLSDAAALAARHGLEVHAGHGLTFDNVAPIAAIAEVMELNIGHFLISEAVFTGLAPAITEMRRLMDEARGALA